MLALLLTALLSQTVYEWTDAQGGTHYTNDRSTIPSTAKKVRTTDGESVTVLKTTPVAAPVKSATPEPKRISCDELKKKVTSLEAQREALFKAYDARVSEAQAQCRSTLATLGQGAYAQCTASVLARAGSAPDDSWLKKDIDAAKDELRRAQIGGCS